MSEKMWGAEPFWGLGYDWDPDWVLTDRQKELRSTLIELRRVLESCPAHKLGLVVSGANLDDGHGYCYDSRPAPLVPVAVTSS